MLGILTLNIAFVLHLILYIPQVLHNRESEHIQYLSVKMHLNLFLCYFLDIFYGFGNNMQWQYRTVSIVGFSLLMIQYMQIIYYLSTHGKQKVARIHILFLASTIYCVYYFFKYLHASIALEQVLIAGYISKILFIISTIPQMIKNWQVKSTKGVNTHFILFNITIASLDTVTAWTLDWAWPNKLTSPIMICMFSTMLPLKKTRIYRILPTTIKSIFN